MTHGVPTKEVSRLLIDICLGPSRQRPRGRIDLDALFRRACDLRVERYVFERLGTVQDSLGSEGARVLAALRERVAGTAVANMRVDAGALIEEAEHWPGRAVWAAFGCLKSGALPRRRVPLTGWTRGRWSEPS